MCFQESMDELEVLEITPNAIGSKKKPEPVKKTVNDDDFDLDFDF